MISKRLARNLSNTDPRIKVDLKELFGKMPERSGALKQAIGGAIIDKIEERALKGNFLEQSAGAGRYSKTYKDSFEFKVFGKSASKVNMKASGDMLRSMDIRDDDGDEIEIGFDDRLSAAKAHGHITGAVGKTRDFFGLTDTDLESIRKEFQSEIDDQVQEESGSTRVAGQRQRVNETLFQFLRRVIGERGVS